MFTAILGAAVLAGVLAVSVTHLPSWLTKLLLKVPAWLQAVILHFGYAGWIGGVTGHLMGAPLAVIWYCIYVWILVPMMQEKISGENTDMPTVVSSLLTKVRDSFTSTKDAVQKCLRPAQVEPSST